MKMTSSRFIIRLIRIRHRLGIILLLLAFVPASKADVGLTHEMKQARAQVLNQIVELRKDSASHLAEIDSLQQLVVTMDTEIMSSYDETVARMAAQKRTQTGNAQVIVFIALGTTFLALFFLALIGIAHERVVRSQNQGLWQVYRQLVIDFVNAVSMEKAQSKQLLRINVVVVAGLVFMSISVIAFLVRTL